MYGGTDTHNFGLRNEESNEKKVNNEWRLGLDKDLAL